MLQNHNILRWYYFCDVISFCGMMKSNMRFDIRRKKFECYNILHCNNFYNILCYYNILRGDGKSTLKQMVLIVTGTFVFCMSITSISVLRRIQIMANTSSLNLKPRRTYEGQSIKSKTDRVINKLYDKWFLPFYFHSLLRPFCSITFVRPRGRSSTIVILLL